MQHIAALVIPRANRANATINLNALLAVRSAPYAISAALWLNVPFAGKRTRLVHVQSSHMTLSLPGINASTCTNARPRAARPRLRASHSRTQRHHA
jgi:hypothetical protein